MHEIQTYGNLSNVKDFSVFLDKFLSGKSENVNIFSNVLNFFLNKAECTIKSFTIYH